MSTSRALLVGLLACAVAGCGGDGAETEGSAPEAMETSELQGEALTLAALWNDGMPAFGIFVPDEQPREDGAGRGGGRGSRPPAIYSAEGGERLGMNELYDYLFLNLEGDYDPAAVTALATGLERAAAAQDGAGPTLLVRIPPISRDGAEVTAARVREILAAGGDGVVFPHIRDVEEAGLAVSFLTDAGADVWSPSNPTGDKIAMLMVEDPDAVAMAEEIAALDGISVLACGIGSLTGALGGDREAAEEGNQQVLAAASAAGLADMITANGEDVEARVEQGFLGLLMSGPQAEAAIRLGRAAAGR